MITHCAPPHALFGRLLSLVEDLERHSVTCQANCLSHSVAGGCLISFVDESWKGRVVDSVESDERSVRMNCPDPAPRTHSICGYPSPGQPDTFVNEEWYGILSVHKDCSKDKVDQLTPRLAYYGLQRLWRDGGCTPHASDLGSNASFDPEVYPNCGHFMVQLRKMWLAEELPYRATNVSLRPLMPNAEWLAKLVSAADDAGAHGDSDCALQQLLHEFDATLCPAPGGHLIDWPEQARAERASHTLITPSVCEQESTMTEDVITVTSLSVLGICLIGALIPTWVFLRGEKSTRKTRQHLYHAARKRLHTITTHQEKLVGKLARKYSLEHVKSFAPGARKARQLPPAVSSTNSRIEKARVQIASMNRFSSLTLALPPAPKLEPDAEFLAARALLEPIAERLATLFGFQTMQPDEVMPKSPKTSAARFSSSSSASPPRADADLADVRSNVQNALDHLSSILAATMQRLEGQGAPPLDERLIIAVYQLYESTFATYVVWTGQMGLVASHADPPAVLHQLMLWYLIWGEAANLRLLPECLCFIFHCMSDALVLSTPAGTSAPGTTDSHRYVDLLKHASSPGGPLAGHANDAQDAVGGFPTPLRLPALREAATAEAAAGVDAASETPISPKRDEAQAQVAGTYPAEDFLQKVVTPIFLVLETQVSIRAQPGKGYSSKIADRAMYDDVNEYFWQREQVDRLLGGQHVLRSPGQAYGVLRKRLSGGEGRLLSLFTKTFYERITWLSVIHTFQRVILFSAMAMWVMGVLAFAHAICESQSENEVPDLGMKDARLAKFNECLRTTRGGVLGWRAFSTCTVPHATLQFIFGLLGLWVTPPSARSWVCTSCSAGWRVWFWRNVNFVVLVVKSASVVLLLITFYIHFFDTGLPKLQSDIAPTFDYFDAIALVYAVAWIIPLLQIPMPLPGYDLHWGGQAPQWTTRPPLSAVMLYVPFWLVTLGIKWSFEYWAVIRPLALPTIALWQGHYRCWETGHTGTQPCIWSPEDSEAQRDVRDVMFRGVLITLRLSVPFLLSLGDTPVFYMMVLAVGSTLRARSHRIGAMDTWAQVVGTFFITQELFIAKCTHSDDGEANESSAVDEDTARDGQAWSWHALSSDSHTFGTAWNALIHSLRARDLLSNSEQDDLLYEELGEAAHRSFFQSDDTPYLVLPTMLSSPVFTVSRDRSIIVPSTTRYAALVPITMQLRDLLLYVLVACGILRRDQRNLAREYASELLRHAESMAGGSSILLLAEQRRLMHDLCVPLTAFLALCAEKAKDANGALRAALQAAEQGDDTALKKQILSLRDAFKKVVDAAAKSVLDDGIDPRFDDDDDAATQLPGGRRRQPARGSSYKKAVALPSSFVSRGSRKNSSMYVNIAKDGGAGVATESTAIDSAAVELSQLSDVTEGTEVSQVSPAAMRAGDAASEVKADSSTDEAQPASAHPMGKRAASDDGGIFRALRMLLSLEADEITALTAKDAARMLLEPATASVLRPLARSFTTLNPGGAVINSEAKRQIVSFCGSLRNTQLEAPPKLRHMKTVSVLTPHFKEDVAYSIETLMASSEDNTTLLDILRALHPDEWTNLRERIGLPVGDISSDETSRVEALSLKKALEAAGTQGAADGPVVATLQDDVVRRNLRRRRSLVESAVCDTPRGVAAKTAMQQLESLVEQQAEPIDGVVTHEESTDVAREVGIALTGEDAALMAESRARDEAEGENWAALQKAVNDSAELPVDVDAELCRWASDRAQVLSRTVRGVMLYADALRIQARLEGIPDDDVEALVASKFEYVVTCQIFAKLRASPNREDQWKVKCINELRHRFAANLRIAYVVGQERYARQGAGPPRRVGYDFYSVLLGVDPTTHEEQVRYKVKLPGNPIIGEGKPENQNHAVIFTRGEHLQGLDMNQDNYLGEAYKLRNMLECFQGNVRIVGCREHIFSEAGGAVAAFAASNEFAFGTSIQRFLAYPLCVRFHYGHPDIWDKRWAMSNGGVSKASRTLHLSEDIFGGFNVIARGGAIVYQEFIHVGKGRDVTFIATNGFEQKISAGNALQCVSRDTMRLSNSFDLARLLSLYCSGPGFFVSATLIVWSAYALSLTLLVLAMLRLETFFPTIDSPYDLQFTGPVLPNQGTSGDAKGMSAEFVLQIGFLMLLPIFAEETLEFGVKYAIGTQVRQQLSLRLLYTFFQERTKAAFFDRALQLGEAKYISTGRSFDALTTSFVALYKAFARTHFVFASELAVILVAYGIYTHIYDGYPPKGLGVYWINTVPLWVFVFACWLSPWLFNPSSLSGVSLRQHFQSFLVWVDSVPTVDSWQRWQDASMAKLRSSSVRTRIGLYVTRVFPQRFVLLLVCMGAFERQELPPHVSIPYSHETMSAWIGLFALGCAVIAFFVADSGSSRTLCGVGVNPAADTSGSMQRVWLRFTLLWVLRIAMIAIHVVVPLRFLGAYLPYSRRNAMTSLITGWAWLTGLTQGFAMLKGPSDGKPSLRKELRRFADFVQREGDMVTATVLVGCLQLLAFLPVSSLHAQLVVNYAYASSLRIVQNRVELMLTVFSATMFSAPRRAFIRLRSSRGWAQCMRACWPFRRHAVADSNDLLNVFVPCADDLPARLNVSGSFRLEREWAKQAPPGRGEDYDDEDEDGGAASDWSDRVRSLTNSANSPTGSGGDAAAPVWLKEVDPNATIVPMGQPPPPSEPPPEMTPRGTNVVAPTPPPSPPGEPDWLSGAAGQLLDSAPSTTQPAVTRLKLGGLARGEESRATARSGASRRSHHQTKMALRLERAAAAGEGKSVPMTPRRMDSETPSWLESNLDDSKLAKQLAKLESIPPAPPELCRMPASVERSFEPGFVRNLLRPIGLTLCKLFGFQREHPLDDNNREGEWVRSNLDNQIEHLTMLLKWRMDRCNTPNAMQALEQAVGELHAKMFANYTRWVRHVNLQRFVQKQFEGQASGRWSQYEQPRKGGRRSSVAAFGGDEHQMMSLSALSGDAWDFCGLWGFASGDDERKWVANAQMHQLMLWYLIWGEAGNLRHMPECLCLILYTMTNSLQLSGGSPWDVATLFDEAKGPYGNRQDDFLHSIVEPLYAFLEHEVMKRKDEPVAQRVMYDDVNEMFWSVDGVHRLLGHGYAHQPTAYQTRVENMARQAYAELRTKLIRAKETGPAVALRKHFRKTYCEKPGWASVYQSFYRVYIFHAVLLHATYAVAFYGWTWDALCTWCITHACMKAVRQLCFMHIVWDLKTPAKQDADEAARRTGLGRGRMWASAPRSFRAFLRNSTFRLVFFLLVPFAYAIETWQRREWVDKTCGLDADAWCVQNVDNGIATAYMPTCIGSDGVNYLLQYCTRCRDGASDDQCPALRDFAGDCVSQCGSIRSAKVIFHYIAALYTVIFVGSYLVFSRSGAMGEFRWNRAESGSIGLGTQYIATPSLLRVPSSTALLYYSVWAIALAVKITFGYYALIEPLVDSVRILAAADYSCWTPWNEAAATPNPYCTTVLPDGPDGANGALSTLRGFCLKVMSVGLRVAVPSIMYFLDTYLWFSWTIGVCSTILGWWMGLGAVGSWSKLINTFDESCHLFNEKLVSNVIPKGESLHREGLSLVSARNLTPQAIRAMSGPNAPAAFLHEARSIEWQRWARAWNEIVYSLRARDQMSNAERDDLLFVSLSRPEHRSFFGVPEYLIFPSMMSAPVFYSRLWHRGLSHMYPHTTRVVLQTRDLTCWLLVALGITSEDQKAELLDVSTHLLEHAASMLRTRNTLLVQLLKEFRQRAVDAISELSKWRKELMDPTYPEGDAKSDAGTASSFFVVRFEEALSAALDAFKALLAGSTGEVDVAKSKSVSKVLEAYTRLRTLIMLQGRYDPDAGGEAIADVLRTPACGEVLRALQRSLNTDNPGGQPRTAEAKRQLLFFCNSLRNRWMPASATVRRMRSMTSFTPHYAEDVTYSEKQLKNLEHRDDGVNLESLLRSLFAEEWSNLCERVRPESESDVPIDELATWASDRSQVLSRTVRGVMLYADALRIQARLEGMHEDEIEAVVASKFEYVVTCQIYGKLKAGKPGSDDLWKAQCIDQLLDEFSGNLRIAYVDTVKPVAGDGSKLPDRFYSLLLGVDPMSKKPEVRYKVKLPGNPIIGEGKPENQNHAVIFTRGEHLQGLDMNQDNYLGEAYKLRNMLECFQGNVRIVGCREHIFSEAGGAVARFAASNEFVFGTSLQRFLTYPLCVRFHYGHPDTWDKQWAITNGGVSKASRTLHLSEDIFAGFNCVMRGGAIVYQEFIHVGKGRDMGFIAINGFEQKISAGNALQCTSRDLYRIGKNFDLPRLMSFYFTGTGFFVTQRLTTAAIYTLTLAYLVLALLQSEALRVTAVRAPNGQIVLSPQWDTAAGPLQRRSLQTGSFFHNASLGYTGQLEDSLEEVRQTWANPAGNETVGEFVGAYATNTYAASFGLAQLGFFSVLPFFLELWMEHDLRHATFENLKLILMGSWMFFLFASQTKGFRLAEAIKYGKAGYVATGRGYVIEPVRALPPHSV